MTIEITDKNFDELIRKSDKPAIIDFWAEWCGPCRAVGSLVNELAEEYEGKAVVGKLDVDANPEVTKEFGIRNIPTILFFKNGELVDKLVGAVPKNNIVSKIDTLL